MLKLMRVKADKLPTLLAYLEKYLPESWVMYCRLRNDLEGRWGGKTYMALVNKHWPNILAVGDGEVDTDRCKCSEYFSDPRTFSFFAPDKDSSKVLLLWPGYLDLTKPLEVEGLSYPCHEAFMEVAQGYPKGYMYRSVLMELKVSDQEPKTIPTGMTIKPLSPDQAEYVASTWMHNSRRHVSSYVTECIKNFPSVSLLDSDGSIVGFELCNDLGLMGFLYVEKYYRGRGFAKIIVSQLAQKCFEEGRRAVCVVVQDNEVSCRLHQEIGFKPLSNNFVWHTYPGVGEKEP